MSSALENFTVHHHHRRRRRRRRHQHKIKPADFFRICGFNFQRLLSRIHFIRMEATANHRYSHLKGRINYNY
jgi:hypothetical protein